MGETCICSLSTSIGIVFDNLQVIIVGIIFGWATGLNKKSAVYDAAELVTW